MKAIFKTLGIALFSAFTSIFLFNYFNSKNETSPEEKEPSKIIPTTYSYALPGSNTELTDFTIAAEKTIDAVVHVKNTAISKNDRMNWSRYFYGSDAESKRIGTGSGVIVSPDGYIITNNHVIEDYSEIEVTLNDNKSYPARLIGSDPTTDIAVLKIITNSPLSYITFGDSNSTRIGEWVLAVGNPFNLNSTVTAGIISAKSRDLSDYDNKNESYIQTDAAVNMGNSGGALVNTKGELIGINTAISSMTGGFVGYSFAVPSNIARKVFEDILEYGDVQKGLLGVNGRALNSALAKELNITDTEGFYIGGVEDGLGAESAGLKSGDIIKVVDGVKIKKFADLTGYLSTKRPDDKVQVLFTREGKESKVMVILKKMKRAIFYGMELKELSDSQKEKFDIEKGVYISEMGNQKLYYNGIEEGSILIGINNDAVEGISSVQNIDLEDIESLVFIKPNGEKIRIIF